MTNELNIAAVSAGAVPIMRRRRSSAVRAPDFDILTQVRFPKIKMLDSSSTPASGEQRIEPFRGHR